MPVCLPVRACACWRLRVCPVRARTCYASSSAPGAPVCAVAAFNACVVLGLFPPCLALFGVRWDPCKKRCRCRGDPHGAAGKLLSAAFQAGHSVAPADYAGRSGSRSPSMSSLRPVVLQHIHDDPQAPKTEANRNLVLGAARLCWLPPWHACSGADWLVSENRLMAMTLAFVLHRCGESSPPTAKRRETLASRTPSAR